jgi:hypothetical protein
VNFQCKGKINYCCFQGEYEDFKNRQFLDDSDEAIEFAQEALEEIIAALSHHSTLKRALSREKEDKEEQR